MTTKLTWDEIRARSESMLGDICTYCGDCSVLNAFGVGLPCRKHAIGDAEHRAIDDYMRGASEALASHPLLVKQ